MYHTNIHKKIKQKLKDNKIEKAHSLKKALLFTNIRLTKKKERKNK